MTVKQDEPSRPVDEEQVDELLGRFVIDLGATTSAGNVNLGDRLGVYRACPRPVLSHPRNWPPAPVRGRGRDAEATGQSP